MQSRPSNNRLMQIYVTVDLQLFVFNIYLNDIQLLQNRL